VTAAGINCHFSRAIICIFHPGHTKGWTEADWLAADPYFSYLGNTDPADWKTIVREADDKERQYEKGLKLPQLRKRINLLTLKDQQ
jgi:hypothetical protein